MKSVIFILAVNLFSIFLFAQPKFEPGVILLQIRQPELISIRGSDVINGSPQLKAVLRQNNAIGSRKLSHVNAETDGWYRIIFPENKPIDAIKTALVECPDIRYVTYNYPRFVIRNFLMTAIRKNGR